MNLKPNLMLLMNVIASADTNYSIPQALCNFWIIGYSIFYLDRKKINTRVVLGGLGLQLLSHLESCEYLGLNRCLDGLLTFLR